MALAREGRIERALTAVGTLSLLALMLIVFIDVAGRNLFNSPLLWGTEVMEVLLGLMVFVFYPVLARRHGHIVVDLVPVPRALRAFQPLDVIEVIEGGRTAARQRDFVELGNDRGGRAAERIRSLAADRIGQRVVALRLPDGQTRRDELKIGVRADRAFKQRFRIEGRDRTRNGGQVFLTAACRDDDVPVADTIFCRGFLRQRHWRPRQ